MGDGAIRINKVNTNDFRDLSDYLVINMHDNENGTIHCMDISFDNLYMFSTGSDGNIFSYVINIKIDQPDLMTPEIPDFPIYPANDIEDADFLSLEEEKHKRNTDIRRKVANAQKDKVLEILAKYEAQFQQITKRNKTLLQSQQMSNKNTVLDQRISDNMHSKLNEHKSVMQRKLAFNSEKQKLQAIKVKDYFISPLNSMPIELHGIRYTYV